jgi:hypothetical protein
MAVARDLRLVDDYLMKWDRFAQGANELVPFLRGKRGAFEAALARLLMARDKRAPARLVFSAVVQIGGFVPVASEPGKAAAGLLGPDFPVTSPEDGEPAYFAGDLFLWWRDHGHRYEAYALFEDWSQRDFARAVVIPMYESACKRA